MANYKITLILLLGFLIQACNRDKEPNNPETITISDITYRDINSIPGSIDPDDWTTETTWPTFITSKILFTDTLNYTWNNDSATFSNMAAYPNPCTNIFNLAVEATKPCIMKFIIVDGSASIQSQRTVRLQSGFNAMSLDVSAPNFLSNNLYRIYYAFLDKNKTIYLKGHGDIKIN